MGGTRRQARRIGGNKLFETDTVGNETGWDYDARNLLIQENGSLAEIARSTLDAY